MKAHTILMYPISYLSLWYLRQLSLPLLPSSQTWETSNHCLPCFISTTNQREFSEYKNCFSPYITDKQTLPLVEVPAYLSPSTSYSDSLRLLACKQEVVLRGRKQYVYQSLLCNRPFLPPSAPTHTKSVNLKALTGINHLWLQGKSKQTFFTLQEERT